MRGKRRIGIVDDDDALRDSLGLLLRFKNYEVAEFSSGEALLAADPAPALDCLILDLKMRGMNGLDVLDAVKARGMMMPVIVVTAFGDVSSAKRALKSGAFDFLEKPIHEDQMLRAITDALAQFDQVLAEAAEQSSLDERIARLTGREKQILDAAVVGILRMDEDGDAKAFAQEYGVTYPLLNGNRRDDLDNVLGPIDGLPRSVVIGRDGVIAAIHEGATLRPTFERDLAKLR